MRLVLGSALFMLACAGANAPSPVPPASPAPAVQEEDQPAKMMWKGGAFSFCFNSTNPVHLANARIVALRLSELAHTPMNPGISCNVEWISEDGPGHTYTRLFASGNKIIKAIVYLHPQATWTDTLHEGGHVLLGWEHSGDRKDLMYATPVVEDFSDRELQTLRELYK